ncbi:Tyrosinase [Colletotrichum trifolii]|uniref:tyrosinase n=1 Tax=Colletotrichum trifolii TaxID=5466 RepID=A0A4R8RLS5_COLTR|nr:Tyrosinase [Colletotrichum trifolii]
MSSDGTQVPVYVRGIPADDPRNPPVRVEVRDMIKDHPDQWNLYLLGLERFKSEAVSEKLPLSYFELAGQLSLIVYRLTGSNAPSAIHGLPYKKWPDQPWNNMTRVDNPFGGFCTHSSILFLSWHRPYLAIFEAELYKHVNFVANAYADDERKADYVRAAKTFRMPYWDWARPDLGVFPPQAASQAANRVVRPRSMPGGSQINPLASYTFRESRTMQDINTFPRVGATVRYPNRRDADGEINAQLLRFFTGEDRRPKGKNLTERVQFILQSYKEFATASTNRFEPSKPSQIDFRAWGSIEDIHNAVHNYVGGGGHMSNPEISSFDPIFWLHHTNIDRLFAIWQAINDKPGDPLTYVTDKRADANWGNFVVKAGDWETINTPLAPFARAGTKERQEFWTSAGVRYTDAFGYAYPETVKARFPTPKDVINELDRVYGKTATFANIMRSSGPDLEKATEELRQRAESHVEAEPLRQAGKLEAAAADRGSQVPISPDTSSASHVSKERSLEKLVGKGNKYLEWLVNIKAEKAELGGNYVVHVFLGAPDDATPILYATNHAHVGAFATFGQSEDTACASCQRGRAAGQQITGQIPITLALVERYLAGFVDGLEPEQVVPYLQKNLHWRVTLTDGSLQDRAGLRNLLVGVVTNEVTIPGNPTDLPEYAEDVVARPDCTTNRDGNGRGSGTGYSG